MQMQSYVIGKISKAALVILCLFMAGKAQAQSATWSSYVNVKYDFSGCYPGNLFVGSGESDSGDGQQFTSTDGAKIYMFGAYVMDDPPFDTLRDEMAWEEANYLGASGKPVFQQLKPDYFVFSGYVGNQIIYEKKLRNHDEFISFVFTYPKAQRAIYDKLISPMLHCFRAG
jgi:uncharacterized membrane protein YjgN (DUF898 family)